MTIGFSVSPHPLSLLEPALKKPTSGETPEKTMETAQEFESVFLAQMLNHMFETSKMEEGPFSGGPGEKLWRKEQAKEFAKCITESGGIGLAERIYQVIVQAQEEGVSTYTGRESFGAVA